MKPTILCGQYLRITSPNIRGCGIKVECVLVTVDYFEGSLWTITKISYISAIRHFYAVGELDNHSPSNSILGT